MKIVIEIPEAFEGHFKQDRFKDSLERLIEDANLLAGNYEIETAEMLIMAFANGTPLPKGHGRLIDVKQIVYEKECVYETDGCCTTRSTPDIHATPTIIEADRGE